LLSPIWRRSSCHDIPYHRTLIFALSLDLSYLCTNPTTSRRASPQCPSYRSFTCPVLSCFLLSWALSMTSKPSSHQDHLLLVNRSGGKTTSSTHPCPRDFLSSFLFVCSSSAHRETEIVIDRSLRYLDYVLRDFVFWHILLLLLHNVYHISIIILRYQEDICQNTHKRKQSRK